MQTEKRAGLPGVIEELIAEPHCFRCAQALRLLLRWLRGQGVTHRQAFESVLRFDNSVSLAFPASEIETLDMELWQDAAVATSRRIHITPAFIGLLVREVQCPYTTLSGSRRYARARTPSAHVRFWI